MLKGILKCGLSALAMTLAILMAGIVARFTMVQIRTASLEIPIRHSRGSGVFAVSSIGAVHWQWIFICAGIVSGLMVVAFWMRSRWN